MMTHIVLVVDDEAAVRNGILKALRRHGYAALGAQDGGEALALATENAGSLRLAIVDRRMPGLSGEQTIEALRQAVPNLPVILSSGDDYSPLEKPSLKQDRAHLRKPFTTDQLLELVRGLEDPQTAPSAL